MMKITQLIEALNAVGKADSSVSVAISKKDVIIAVDASGSTGTTFGPRGCGMTVLEKIQEVVMVYMLKNPENNYFIYSFDSEFINHGKCDVMVEEGFVQLPAMRPGSCTETAKPLLDICVKLNTLKPDIVKLFTDGNTNSGASDLKRATDKFKEMNIRFEVSAVTTTSTDMEVITRNEETRIPGMDLVNTLGNSIDSLEIYNLFHHTDPYVGMMNSSVGKNNIKFMGIEVNIPVIQFLRELVEKIDEHKNEINWGPSSIDLKKMLSEIGKLWSLVTIEFNEEHPYIINTALALESFLATTTGVDGFTSERIINFIKYGFNCTKNNKPIIMTNFEAKIKESATKHNEFGSAVQALDANGTALNADKIICMPSARGMCVIMNKNTLPLTKEGGTNSSKDKYGNVYFGIDADPQAIRIGMRNYAGKLGFPNSRGSASVVFMTACQMSLMSIKGENLDSPYMNELRKLAISQTSMEGMVGKNQYDGVGFFIKWKSGIIPPMHYSNPKTHASLSTDKMINPLSLPETIWWALMMAMLDIFDEQLGNYRSAIEALGIEPTKDNFLQFIKTEYESKIDGVVGTATIRAKDKSVFTLEDFPAGEQVFIFKNHKNRSGQDCRANTWYSKSEIDEYVNVSGCVWCRSRPLPDELEQIDAIGEDEKLSQMTRTCSVLRCNVASLPMAPATATATSGAGLSSAMANLSMASASSGTNKFRINLHGVTGAGKSTTAAMMKELIENNNGNAIIVSADKYSKNGMKGKNLAKTINKDIVKFNESTKDGIKVIIMDLCNESGSSKSAFNFNFNEYTDFDFYPQLNKDMIDEYEAWCLKNVISRPACTRECTYWLNPVEAKLNVCISVHKGKNEKFRMFIGARPTNNNFNEDDSRAVIDEKVNEKAGIYANYLATINSHDVVAKFLSDSNLLR
jgi:hypothetical protein